MLWITNLILKKEVKETKLYVLESKPNIYGLESGQIQKLAWPTMFNFSLLMDQY